MEKKPNRQQLACDFIFENYIQFRRLRFDTITQKVQICDALDPPSSSLTDPTLPAHWRYLTNADINTMVCDCSSATGIHITAREIITVLNAGNSYIPHIHPLREYILSLKPYTSDQPDWIDMVARQVKTIGPHLTSPSRGGKEPKSTLPLEGGDEGGHADELWGVCFKKWFVAMVASWMRDDIVNHQVLVLIGKQGIYKTTWLEHLIPPHLRDYCCKLANATQLSKDDRLRIAEFGLINLDELDAMTPRELNVMKSVITASDVNERVAYGYTKERRVRLASFCGSSNRREFLTDITGNRRWMPFEVEAIQNPFFTTLPYDLMYAQAWALVNDPTYSYWLELEEIAVLEEHNETFRAQDSEEQLLPILFDIPAEGKGEFMTTAQISERLVTFGNIKKPMAVSRLGTLLGAAGYKSVTRGSRGARVRGWIVYQRDTNEINANKTLLAKECVTM